MRITRQRLRKRLLHHSKPNALPHIHEQIVLVAVARVVLPDPDLLGLVESRRVLQLVLRYDDVLEEAQGHVHAVLVAAAYLADDDLLHEGTKDDVAKDDFGVGGTVAREYVGFLDLGEVVEGDAEADVQVDLVGELAVQLLGYGVVEFFLELPRGYADGVLHFGQDEHYR